MGTLPAYIAFPLRTLAFAATGLSIFSSLNVHLLVVDPSGRRTGFDASTGATLTEIPSSRYGVTFTGAPGDADSSRELDASFTGPDRLPDGTYTLSVIGQSPGPFHVSISIYREPLSEDFNLGGIIGRNERREYRIVYNSSPFVPVLIDSATTTSH